MLLCLFEVGNIFCILIGISSKKLESWLDEQDEDLNDLRAEMKKERKQHENTLRVTASSHKLFLCRTNPFTCYFNALTRLFGWQEGHPACNKLAPVISKVLHWYGQTYTESDWDEQGEGERENELGMKKRPARGLMQTLRAGCSKAEPEIFVPPQIPSRGRRTAKI